MSLIGNWKEKIAQYVDVRVQLVKLSFIDRTSNILSYLILMFISLFLGLAILIFAGMGIAEWFAGIFDSRAGGYFTAVGFYLLLMGLLYLTRGVILKTFAGIFIRVLTEGDDDDDDDDKEKERARQKARQEKNTD
jgi:hypothetical protein